MFEDHQSPRSRRATPAHSLRLRALTAAAGLVAVASVPISGTGIATAAGPAPGTGTAVSYDTTGPPPGGVPGVPVPTIRWADAGEGYQQAYAAVPYDYARPTGKTFRLKLVRLPATDTAHRIGSLFINFGGPGDTAAGKVRQIGKFLLPLSVLARYDLVGVDPRGTGGSQPVRCTASTSEQLAFPYATAAKFPVTRAEQAEAIQQVRRYGAQCRARNGDLLDHVGTLAFARDLDVLRAALGDRWINYYGLSYGTFLGQVLANTFPTRTGALVLDGVVDPAWANGPAGSISWLRENAAAGSWQTLHRFFRLCTRAGPAHCAFATGGEPQQKYAQLAARLRAHPLMIPVPNSPAQSLGYAELVGATVSSLYFGPAWPLLGQLLQAAYLGDAPTVALLAQQLVPPPTPGYNNYRDANTAITCGDTSNPRDPRRYRKVAHHADATTPYVGSLWAYGALPCASWHGHAADRYTGPWTARTRTPVLIIANTYDPATPYRNAITVHRLLPHSALLTVDGVGHTSLFASTCATALTAQYLLTRATPSPSTVCRQDTGPFDTAPPPTPTTRRGYP
jgi:pimeloyl-ACP methyl ester carboxylesterase